MKKGVYKLDKYYNFVRPKDYVSCGHLTVEDEIVDSCKKNRIVIQEILELNTWRVIGTKVRSHKDREALQKSIDENKNKPKIVLTVKNTLKEIKKAKKAIKLLK